MSETGREVAVVEADDPQEDEPVTPTGRALTLQQREQVAGLIRPVAPPSEVLAAQNETRALIEQALQKGRDFDTIPGTGKPSLLKPGGERITAAMGCFPRYRIVEQEVDHDREVEYVKRTWEWGQKRGEKIWTEAPGRSQGLYRYVVECEIVHRGSGVVIGQGIGSCSTMETKYIDRPRDMENTVIKMAEKRAFVGATLNAFGLSDQFTQDVEDNPQAYAEPEAAPDPSAPDAEPEARCPRCRGPMWDNREGKKNPKAPDFKCRDKSCEGVYWPGQWPPPKVEGAKASPDQRKQLERLCVAVGKHQDKLSDKRKKNLKTANSLLAAESLRAHDAQEGIRLLEAVLLDVAPTERPPDGLPFEDPDFDDGYPTDDGQEPPTGELPLDDARQGAGAPH